VSVGLGRCRSVPRCRCVGRWQVGIDWHSLAWRSSVLCRCDARPFGAMRCQSMPAAQQLALFCVDVDALNFSRILLIRCDAAVCLKLGADHCTQSLRSIDRPPHLKFIAIKKCKIKLFRCAPLTLPAAAVAAAAQAGSLVAANDRSAFSFTLTNPKTAIACE
jgi:hypothetical protein